MKSVFLMIVFSLAAMIGYGQKVAKKPVQAPPAKVKLYLLGLRTDSAGTANVDKQLEKVLRDLNASEASHIDVAQDIDFIKNLKAVFKQQKIDQDAEYKKAADTTKAKPPSTGKTTQ